MGRKVLIVLTSADKMGSSGTPTGWYLPEVAHPYKVLVDAGFEVDVMSPKGGKSPVISDQTTKLSYAKDPVCCWFIDDAKAQQLVNNTKTYDQVDASDYSAVYYPGGHGPMFDLSTDTSIAKIAAEIYENGGVIAADCHGSAAFVPIKLSNGESLVKGKKLTSFSNTEEEAYGFTKHMPFLLETKLCDLGALYSKADNWKECVVVDGRLLTGQNPASAPLVGKELLKLLS